MHTTTWKKTPTQTIGPVVVVTDGVGSVLPAVGELVGVPVAGAVDVVGVAVTGGAVVDAAVGSAVGGVVTEAVGSVAPDVDAEVGCAGGGVLVGCVVTGGVLVGAEESVELPADEDDDAADDDDDEVSGSVGSCGDCADEEAGGATGPVVSPGRAGTAVGNTAGGRGPCPLATEESLAGRVGASGEAVAREADAGGLGAGSCEASSRGATVRPSAGVLEPLEAGDPTDPKEDDGAVEDADTVGAAVFLTGWWAPCW